MDGYNSGNLAIAVGAMMLKYNVISQNLSFQSIKLNSGDKVNVFINLETVLRNIFLNKRLTELVQFHKQRVVLELESAILNLMGHYRSYFIMNNINPRMFFFITNLNETDQEMKIYNKYYRDYYHNKYMEDPHFSSMGDLFVKTILPELNLILTYIPNCYLLTSNIFDSSLIPKIIYNINPNRKNIIFSGDVFDTLYLHDPQFIEFYIKRRYKDFKVVSTIESAINSILTSSTDTDDDIIYSNELYYRLLLSVRGSKIRNIKTAKGFSYGKLTKIIKTEINMGNILNEYSSIESIIEIFPEIYRNGIKEAFQCTSLDVQYDLLTNENIEYIKDQMIDKMDYASLESLNLHRFSEFPINIPTLLN